MLKKPTKKLRTLPKTYTLAELEEVLHLTRCTLLAYIKAGKLKAHRVTNKWIVTETDLEAFMNGLQD